MASLAGIRSQTDAIVALSRLDSAGLQLTGTSRLDRMHAFVSNGVSPRALSILAGAHARAARIGAGGGRNSASDALAANVYAGDVVARLAAEGDLDPVDTRVMVGALADACSIPLAAAAFELFLRATSSPALVELPPTVAAEIQLRLLIHLDVATEISLWRRADDDDPQCVLSLGADPTDRHVRGLARAAMTGRSRIAVGGRALRAGTVRRAGVVNAVVVARVPEGPTHDIEPYLLEACLALEPVLERGLLLERNTDHAQSLTASAEKRLTRLGFDLHDGPVQEVLALGAETRRLRDDVYPFVLDGHRDLVRGRFDDLVARLVELDASLRETAHALESKSIVSRPVSEILHREADAFAARTGIDVSVGVRGDPETLSPSQRIAIFRAVQEALANVREHSGATSVQIRLRVRRGSVNVSISDDGQGFEVSRSLAHAAERGRLGLVGIGERMRMLGGSFAIESQPGGPTTLRFSLPRWDPFQNISGERG